jgi:hypothetical protein
MTNLSTVDPAENVTQPVTAIPVSQPAAPQPAASPNVPICEHIKDNGIRCGSPAMRHVHFCYFHRRAHHPPVPLGDRDYVPPVMESRESLQIAITHVLQALTSGNIQPKVANSIFYGIFLATKTLRMPADAAPAETSALATTIPLHMQCVLENRTAPQPADYHPDSIAKLVAALRHPDEIARYYKSLDKGPSHHAFVEARYCLQAHNAARQMLREMGLLRQYSLDPENDFWAEEQAAQPPSAPTS